VVLVELQTAAMVTSLMVTCLTKFSKTVRLSNLNMVQVLQAPQESTTLELSEVQTSKIMKSQNTIRAPIKPIKCVALALEESLQLKQEQPIIQEETEEGTDNRISNQAAEPMVVKTTSGESIIIGKAGKELIQLVVAQQ
jgi:hypothetical protein